jgi:DNA-directed RNA polymerase specialized sigma24 family protein
MDKKKALAVVEHHLRSYKTYQIGIKNLQKSLNDILPSITTNYTLREGTNGSFDITSNVETAVLDRLEGSKAIYLREQIRELETIIQSIDEAVAALGEKEREFITYRYFEGFDVDKTSSMMGYSTDGLYRFRNRILDKLFISLRNIVQVSVQFL